MWRFFCDGDVLCGVSLVATALWEPPEWSDAERSDVRSGLEWSDVWSGWESSDVWSGAKFLLCSLVVFSCCGGVSGVCLVLVTAVHVASVSRPFFSSLQALGEPGAKGWVSPCRVTTESYIIEM